MQVTDEIYGKNYYHSHCGIPYHRGEPHWLRFFGNVAREINRSIAPKTVFDAGCAIGFLVETLRKEGIEAFGRDISHYAIDQVPSGLKSFVECGSISSAINGTFDLVTCIEVLEHMPIEEARKAVKNFCNVAPKVLFSSSPTDFTEETHINVQPPIYWMQLFAEYGFGPIASFDGSFLCPWAILFERRSARPTDVELEVQSRLVMARMEAAENQHAAQQKENQHQELKQQSDIEINRLRSSIAFLKQRITNEEASEKSRKRWWRLRGNCSSKSVSGRNAPKAQEDAIRASGLFDTQWYLAEYPDVAEASLDAVHHYFVCGADEGRNPNPVFETSYYVTAHKEVFDSKLNPLFHYLTRGYKASLKPSWDFDPAWYRETYADVAASGVDPLLHYLRDGRFEGRRRNECDYGDDVTKARIETVKVLADTTELVLFVTHAPDGRVKPHVLCHVSELRKIGLSVCVIVAADDIESVDVEVLLNHVDGLFVRENGGFDFAAWAHVARMINLSETQLLVLTNDSIIGPFNSAAMRKVADKIHSSDAALVGLTDNREIKYHFQSYFLAAKRAGVQVLAEYLNDVRSFGCKQDVITSYEINLLDAFTSKGLTGEVLFPSQGPANRTITEWRELVQEGFPYLKVAVLQSHEPEVWKEFVAEAGFNIQMIEETLKIIQAGIYTAASVDGNSLKEPEGQLQTSFAKAMERQKAAQTRIAWLEQELTKARRQPWKLVRNKAKFVVYKALSRWSLPFSSKVAAKYAVKARDRRPEKHVSSLT